ncbi:hypothetical protein DTW90_21975 [Neorhizobium sp. P12A]|uniref:hypothetical protein n=1 Tax=Neorhizobium sp. P12A TaxID=2268027 RepID=UPI0011EC198F|nr:hypothetical protein [Neorhizobium sp. P12A]KAA0695647.1 hypothetical protein DTW90_21975 [Neorhizobium sp. P12A]
MLSSDELKDLENQVREEEDGPGYFAEALSTFRSGSYRSCVLMMSNAVFAHAYQKLAHAASVDAKYLVTLKDVDDKRSDGDAYEARLASCLAGTDLIDEAKSDYLKELRRLRNHAAHPNGRKVRDSEAAHLLREGVKLFLSQRNLDPLVTVEEIAARVMEPDYFPREDQRSVLDLVASEISLLPPSAYQRLVERILKLLKTDDLAVTRNATAFLCACVEIPDELLKIAVVKKLMMAKLGRGQPHPDAFMLAIVRVLDRSPECLRYLEADDRQRLDAKVANFFLSPKAAHAELRGSESVIVHIVGDRRESKSEFEHLRAALARSLALGFLLIGNQDLPSAVREMIVRNLATVASRPNRSGEFLSFVEANGDELVQRLTDQDAHRLWAALEIRRTHYVNGKSNLDPVGGFKVDPRGLKLPDSEAAIAQLETVLRERVREARLAHPEEMEKNARRSKLPFPAAPGESLVSHLTSIAS